MSRRPKLNFADVALSWLTFPRRVGRRVDIFGGRPRDDGARREVALDDPIVKAFIEEIALRPPIRTFDEVQHVVTDFFAQFPTLPDWWKAVLSGNRIDFVFDNAEPRIQTEGPVLERWRAISVKLDPDTLITLEFARRYKKRCALADLNGWGTIARSQSPDIRRLFLDPDHVRIYETHVHLEGCEPAPLLWQRVLTGALRPQDFEQYRTRSQSNESASREAVEDELAAEMRLIGQAIEARHALLARYPMPLQGAQPPPDPCEFASANVAVLWPERQFLTGAWSLLQDLAAPDGAIVHKPSQDVARDLDLYTQGKSAFLSRIVQGPLGNPGLATFKRYFRRGKILPRIATRGAKNPAHANRGPSRRLMWERWNRMGRFATENKGLAGIEFRIAPFSRVKDYVRFFEDFQRHRADFAAHPDIDISFIVHFIRQEPTAPYLTPFKGVYRPVGHGLRLHAAAVDDAEARRSLDRQSAVLHRFRLSYPDLARLIVGIDVANIERRNPVHLASPYLRLLRGLQEDEMPYGFHDESDPNYRRWRGIHDEKTQIVPAGVGPLGLTYHVGEDFFHPIEGLKAIWEYMNFCTVRSGDRIGHGLALGVDIRDFNLQRGRYGVMPRGEALDVLVWMRHRLAIMPGASQHVLRKIEDDIAELSTKVYLAEQPCHELYALLRARHGLSRDTKAMSATVKTLLEEETRPKTSERRITYDRLPTSLIDERSEPDLNALQREIVREVIERELYVEVNPSSNINILTLPSIENHPVLKLLKTVPDLKITVNTDDPGTFATSLEVEYALAREGLLLNKIGNEQDWIEKFARLSEQAAFSTPPQRARTVPARGRAARES